MTSTPDPAQVAAADPHASQTQLPAATQPTPPQANTCESQGRYTYNGPSSPGVRETGMCIDCSTETYIAYAGSCAPPVITVSDESQRAPNASQIASQSIEGSRLLITSKSQKKGAIGSKRKNVPEIELAFLKADIPTESEPASVKAAGSDSQPRAQSLTSKPRKAPTLGSRSAVPHAQPGKTRKVLVLQDKTHGAAHMTSELYAMPSQTASGPGVIIYIGAYSLAVLSKIFRKKK